MQTDRTAKHAHNSTGHPKWFVEELPAKEWGAWNADAAVIVKPPAVCEAKGEGQELRLGGQLVGNEQASIVQQGLAILQSVGYVSCRVQHVGCQQDMEGAKRRSLCQSQLSQTPFEQEGRTTKIPL
jgi:hypothetical protein